MNETFCFPHQLMIILMICQLGFSLSAQLQYVSSAQLHVPAQLSYNVPAQVHSVSSAATCQLSCIL